MNGWRLSLRAVTLSAALVGVAQGTMHRSPSVRVALDGGNLVIRLPRSVTITRHSLNFETDEYVVYRRPDGHELLRMIVGGGAYDLRRYQAICLNHRKAWRLASRHGMEIVAGEPGANAVSASYEDLSPEDALVVRKIMASIEFRDGRYCR